MKLFTSKHKPATSNTLSTKAVHIAKWLTFVGVLALASFHVHALEGTSVTPAAAVKPVIGFNLSSNAPSNARLPQIEEYLLEEPVGVADVPVMQLAQSGSIKSRSEVVSEVKRSYGSDVEVLKVSLSGDKSRYQVRILMPDGKVKSVSVSAKK